MTERHALTFGRDQLRALVKTTVTDAARVAAGADMAARPRVQGYVRMLNPPSCPRCVVLAGRFYRWNAGFRRHPQLMMGLTGDGQVDDALLRARD
ncbi:hypothetical protein, partial [Micrococcus sp. F3Y]|uniref:hypothetical protein n=1 Tax=Micrococcus sp. F3Y TaxID=3402627 RepID=UPI003AF8FC93